MIKIVTTKRIRIGSGFNVVPGSGSRGKKIEIFQVFLLYFCLKPFSFLYIFKIFISEIFKGVTLTFYITLKSDFEIKFKNFLLVIAFLVY